MKISPEIAAFNHAVEIADYILGPLFESASPTQLVCWLRRCGFADSANELEQAGLALGYFREFQNLKQNKQNERQVNES